MMKATWIKKAVMGLLVTGVGFGVYGISTRIYQSMSLHKLVESAPQTKSIVQALTQHEWETASTLITQAINEKKLKKDDIKNLIRCCPNSPIAQAWIATSAILDLPQTGLTFQILFPIALYRETHTNEQLKKLGLYVPEEKFGREVQFDPESNIFFIHLGTHNVKAIGKGRQKIVTKTIAYDRKNPKIYARGLTSVDIRKEMEAMRALKDKDGLLSAVAFLIHRDPITKCKMYAIVTPICNRGSLQGLLDDATIRLSFGEKLKIAKNIITGLASMHASGFTHRDLGARNYFVTLTNQTFGNRSIDCVIADFGRTRPVTEVEAAAVQGNHYYFAPEGLLPEQLKGPMYYSTDLFAVGCVFWQLYFGTLPPWSTKSKTKEAPVEAREAERQQLIENIMKGRNHAMMILEKLKTSENTKAECHFLKAILKMTHPDSKERGTAEEIKNMICSLDELHA